MSDKKQITLPSISSLTEVPTGLRYLALPEGILEVSEVVKSKFLSFFLECKKCAGALHCMQSMGALHTPGFAALHHPAACWFCW